MGTGRRTGRLLVALALVGVPAVVMRVMCVGQACESAAEPSTNTPFCSLPADIRRDLTAGFREERSPDVFAVSPVAGSVESRHGIWPGVADGPQTGVVLFAGSGAPEELPGSMSFDQVAPTIAEIVGLQRAHPEVRSGRSVDVDLGDERPQLVVLIGLKGAATPGDLPASLSALAEDGATTEAWYGSEPVDPAAIFTTVGTGGLPHQHGITGSVLRDADGTFGRAWVETRNFDTTSVIATLADDLDETHGQRASVGMVANHPGDRGLIGGGWYVGADEDPFVVEPSPRAAADEGVAMLRNMDPGRPGVFALSLDAEGRAEAVDRAVTGVLEAADEVAAGSLLVVVVGVDPTPTPAISLNELVDELGEDARLVEGIAGGGFFLDQERLAEEGVTEDTLVRKLEDMRFVHRPGRSPQPFADVFSGISVAFGRYC